MDLERRSLRIGAIVVAGAIFLRLLMGGAVGRVARALGSPEAASFLMYMETGRFLRPMNSAAPPSETASPPETSLPPATTAPPATQPVTEPPVQTVGPAPVVEKAVFTPEDAALVSVRSYCGYEADTAAWLTQPLDWDLTGPGPTVLILHSHTSEAYENTEGYEEAGGSYRTLDERYNMISVGDRIAEVLSAGGISVVHDRTVHDYPSYNDSYDNSRASAASYLEKYPTIRLVLDIHRDAMEDGHGNQLSTTATVDGQTSAQLMLVVGTDAGGQNHPRWRENMALAVKLHATLEKAQPGLCRPISFRSSRFNQDQSPGSILVEVGAAGNTRQEALLAAGELGKAILTLAKGAN